MNTHAEKRISNRKSINTPVTIASIPLDAKETLYDAMTSNISFNGLCLYTQEENILIDHDYQIKLSVLMRGYYVSLNLNAKAIYKQKHNYHRFIIGFKFTEITPEFQEKLDAILDPKAR